MKRSLAHAKKQLSKENTPKINPENQKKIDRLLGKKTKKELQYQRIIEAIALKEKIFPSLEEVEEETQCILRGFPSPQEVQKYFPSPYELKSKVNLSLCYEKTLQFLEKENNLTEDIDKEIKKLT